MFSIVKKSVTGGEQLNRLYQEKLEKSANTLFICLAAALLFLLIPDYFLIPELFWMYALSKIALVLSIYFIKNTLPSTIKSISIWIHVSLFIFSLCCLYMLSISNKVSNILYVNVLAIGFCLFNSFIVWKSRNSFLQFLILILSFYLFVYLGIITDQFEVIQNAGPVLVSLILVSAFIPKIRKSEFIVSVGNQYAKDQLIDTLKEELDRSKSVQTELQNSLELITERFDVVFEDFDKKIKTINNLSLILRQKYSNAIAQSLKEKITEIGVLSSEIVAKSNLIQDP